MPGIIFGKRVQNEILVTKSGGSVVFQHAIDQFECVPGVHDAFMGRRTGEYH